MMTTTVALAMVGGVACQALARWLRVPAIVPLLVSGVLLGPDVLGWVVPSSLGDGLKVIVGFAVAVILFEGGLSLKTETLRLSGSAIRRLVGLGAVLTWFLCTGLAVLLFPDLGLGPATLFGALVIVTGPTVIFPLLNTIRPRKRVADILRGEAILIDPVGALLAVLTLEFLLERGVENGLGHLAEAFLGRVGLGLLLGILGGLALDQLLRRQHDVAPEFKNRTVFVAAIGMYALSESLASESGVLTVTLAGFVLGWRHPPGLDDIEEFKGHIVAVLVSTVFILLSAGLSLSSMGDLGWSGVWLVLGVMLVVRPLTVFLSMIGTGLSLREKLFLSWIAPRGIVAASVSSLFAIILADSAREHGAPELAIQGTQVMAMTFAVIAGTVLVQGPTAGWVGRMLDVLERGPTGFLILGGNAAGRALGRVLHQDGHRVLLLDTNYGAVRRAREMGIDARRADALDETVTERLNFQGIGALLAVTTNDSVNRLAVRLYTKPFTSRRVRAIRTQDSPSREETPSLPPWLFGDQLTVEKMLGLLAEGATIEIAAIDEDTTVEAAMGALEGSFPLFGLDSKDQVRFLDPGSKLSKGDTLLFLDPKA